MTALTPRPQPGILDIAPYVSGQSNIGGKAATLKLSANENPFGAPQTAVAAMAEVLANIHRYPTVDHQNLRMAIADVHGLDAEKIIIGVGSDEILQMLAYAYAGPGDEVICTEHGFSLYPIVTRAAGARPVVVPEAGRVVDIDAILAAVTPRTRMVFVTNPGNPTGTMVPGSELARLADALPSDVLLVLDGAYVEFVGNDFDGGADLAGRRENVVMTRTFSKIYGLGGLRVGWGYGPVAVIDALNRIRGPFNMSLVALAGAEAAMLDRAFVDKCQTVNAEERARLTGGLRQLGVACDDSHANFVLARFEGAEAALAADAKLKSAGIIVRQVGGYGFPEGLRITVGRPEDVTAVLEALT